MDLTYQAYLERSSNELNLASIIFKISIDKKLQIDIFKTSEDTYFSAVITHSYYSIFYAAKAYLLKKKIKISPPEEHRKTLTAFENFVTKGIVSTELLNIYRRIMVRAETLLSIFELEKDKRSNFTYKKMSQANQEPANQSTQNARVFLTHITRLCSEL